MNSRLLCATAVLTALMAGCALADSDTADSKLFTIDNRDKDEPTASNTRSPQGRHFIPGMPGTLTFQTDVQWNGEPGSVYFTINGTSHQAGITDLGGGNARAEVTVAAPASVAACNEITVEVTNAEGMTAVVTGGLYFHPVPAVVPKWYGDNIPWVVSHDKLKHSVQTSYDFWDLSDRSGVLNTKATVSNEWGVSFDKMAGTFTGSMAGSGSFTASLEFQGVENFGTGRVGSEGSLGVQFPGCGDPRVTPGWDYSLGGSVGLGFPVVRLVQLIPPLTAPIEGVLKVPVLSNILTALRIRAFLAGGGAVAGEYSGMTINPSCFLGATGLTGSLTLGLEGQTAIKAGPAEVGVTVEGVGTPELLLCPELQFQGVVIKLYAGVYASLYEFQVEEKVGSELRLWGPSGHTMNATPDKVLQSSPAATWQPIGDTLLKYGEMNRLPAATAVTTLSADPPTQSGGSTEEVVVENVTRLSGPCILADSDGSRMLFPLHDANKPWYAATDVAYLHSAGGSWSLERVTNDQAAEFTPHASVPDAGSALAAWSRVSGDASQVTSPEQVAPMLDIVVSKLDAASGQWSTPTQITSNSVVDRDPLSIVFGPDEGVLWIQNEADAAPGNATHGDRLMFSGWNGSTWSAPVVLWSGSKGLINLACVEDDSGQAHAVFSVDEDGDLQTRTDRELYQVSTSGGVWGSPVRLTNDEVEDSLPALVAPGGEPVIIWSVGGVLNYTPLASWNPKDVYGEYTISNEAATLDGVTMPGGAAIAYSVQLPTGIDIVVAFYDAALDSWSLPRQLTNDTDVETALSLGCDGDGLVIGYLKNRTVRGPVDVVIDGKIERLENIAQPSRTDLCVLRHTLGNDLAAGAIAVDPVNPAPGAATTLTATVENRGDEPQSNIDVAFYDGDPLSGGVQIGTTQSIAGPLGAGKSQSVTVPWDVPADGKSHRVYVVVDAGQSVEDRNRSNNTSSILCVLPDLVVETGWSDTITSEAVAITAKVANQGVLDAGEFELAWHIGTPDGPEIGRSPVEGLAGGGSAEVTYVWTLGQVATQEFVQVCAVADCRNTVTEADEANNTGIQTVRAPYFEEPSNLRIGAAKQAGHGAAVYLGAKVVTATFPGFLYIEESDRSAGIRVSAGGSYNVGDVVSVTGRLDASGDELAVVADSVTAAGTAVAPGPVSMLSLRLGGAAHGAQAGVQNGTGLNNIGLLVRTWGRVTQTGEGYLYVDDLCGLADSTLTGSAPNTGVRVVCDSSGYAAGEYLLVTGISSCFRNDSGQLQRRILARTAADVQSDARLPLNMPRVSGVKSAPQGSAVSVAGKKVASAFGGFFYVEELDRSSGIKVVSDASVNPGDLAWITGETGTFNGEHQIWAYSVTSQPDPFLIRPLGVVTPSLGGSAFGRQPGVAGGVGLTNVGLLVRVWGRVTQVGSGYLYIDDGAGLMDGSATFGALNQGVRVICDPAGYSPGDFLMVTGASSCYPAGFGYGRQVYAIEIQSVAN